MLGLDCEDYTFLDHADFEYKYNHDFFLTDSVEMPELNASFG